MKANGSNVLSRLTCFLGQPELMTHREPTAEDLEAKQIIQEIVDMYGTPNDLRVSAWERQPDADWVQPDKLPALRTAGGIFYGLEAIKSIAAVERKEWRRAWEYGGR
jgi:hypothetical protein